MNPFTLDDATLIAFLDKAIRSGPLPSIVKVQHRFLDDNDGFNHASIEFGVKLTTPPRVEFPAGNQETVWLGLAIPKGSPAEDRVSVTERLNMAIYSVRQMRALEEEYGRS